MKLDVIFKGMSSTEAMERYVEKYVEKFQKYLGKENPDSVFMHVTLEGNHNHHINSVETHIKTPHFNLNAKREGKDMYPLIDETMHIMEQELQKAKQRIVDDLRKKKKLSEEF